VYSVWFPVGKSREQVWDYKNLLTSEFLADIEPLRKRRMAYICDMKTLLTICLAGLLFSACDPVRKAPVEPHLELGQRIIFSGANSDRAYIVLGYKSELDGDIEKSWQNQDYIVFLYTNDHGDLKRATIHQNAILKE
jgi:hypothetical protein